MDARVVTPVKTSTYSVCGDVGVQDPELAERVLSSRFQETY